MGIKSCLKGCKKVMASPLSHSEFLFVLLASWLLGVALNYVTPKLEKVVKVLHEYDSFHVKHLKKAWILILMFWPVSQPLYADVFTARIDASVTNIPISYAGANAKVFPHSVRNSQSVFVNNRTSGGTSAEIAINCSTGDTHVPADNGQDANGLDHNIYVNASEAYSFSTPAIANNCWIRSMTGAPITSGIFVVNMTGG